MQGHASLVISFQLQAKTMYLFNTHQNFSGLSCMIQGAHDGEKFIVKHYAEPDVFQIIDDYMSTFKKT